MSEYKTTGGDVLHCPACGAVVPASASICPKCGHEFSNIEANATATGLAMALAMVEDYDAKCQIIETFPVPNSKADLLELVTSMKPKIKRVNDPLAESYLVKYEELIEKIKVSFPNDKQLKPFADEYETLKATILAAQKKSDKQYWLSEHSKLLVFCGLVVIALIAGGIWAFMNRSTTGNTPEQCSSAVESALAKGDIKSARNYILSYQNAKDDIIDCYANVLSAYLDEGNWEEAKSLVAFYGQGEYTQPLNRGLYNYLLATGDFDKAEEYINVEEKPANDEYYEYMEECVKQLCMAGKKDEAKLFVARKSTFFASNRAGTYSKSRVEERLNKLIASY